MSDRLAARGARRTVVSAGLVTAAGHRFAGRRRVSVRRLEGLPLITLEEGTGLRTALEQACRDAGFPPRIVAETGEIRSLLDLTAADLGVAVVPRSVGDDPRLSMSTLTPRVERPVGLAWNDAATSPAVRAFLALADHHFADDPATPAPQPPALTLAHPPAVAEGR